MLNIQSTNDSKLIIYFFLFQPNQPDISDFAYDVIRELVIIDTQVYAFKITLVKAGKKIFNEIFHSYTLNEEQLRNSLIKLISDINHLYNLNFSWFTQIYSLDVGLCPIPPYPFAHRYELVRAKEQQRIFITQNDSDGSWYQIWVCKYFNAELLAIYANLTTQEAEGLMQGLEKAGYVQLERLQGKLRVISHSFVPDLDRKTYIPHLNSTSYAVKPSKSHQQDHKSVSSSQAIWNSMRILNIFNVNQLKLVLEINKYSVLKYILQLKKAGYLHELNLSDISVLDEYKSYRLVRNSGSIAPLICTKTLVFDMNTKTLYKLNS